ncbi:MAG TPA: hypothetical protein VE170_05800, partial [Candidatus Limnocylindria bacterium]|nr:hypothetical protein [Candidatus Limnocylindria bacterium]
FNCMVHLANLIGRLGVTQRLSGFFALIKATNVPTLYVPAECRSVLDVRQRLIKFPEDDTELRLDDRGNFHGASATRIPLRKAHVIF